MNVYPYSIHSVCVHSLLNIMKLNVIALQQALYNICVAYKVSILFTAVICESYFVYYYITLYTILYVML